MKLILLFSFFLCSVCVSAQTCTGSLGDPIVNITFGSGSGYGPPLAAGTTSSLSYEQSTCPFDGNYAILNYTSGCWGSDVVWHTATDHTGDYNGYFMLINASYQPSDFYLQTVNGLCEGTTYRFAAWLVNISGVSGILPNITMTIESTGGNVLATYKTGDIPIVHPLTWQQSGFNFTTPSGVSTVVLRMRNNAPGGMGNDVGLDDITFRPIGPAVSVSTATVSGDTASVCEDNTDPLILEATAEQCYVSTAYQWQQSTDNGATWNDIEGATNLTYTRVPTPAGTYLYRLATAQSSNIGISTCRVTSEAFTVIVYGTNVRSVSILQDDDAVCEGKPATFTANGLNGGNTPVYEWQINGTHAGSNSPSLTSNNLSSGDVVQVVFTSSLPCNSPALSNAIHITASKPVYDTLYQAICEGDNYAGYTTAGTYTDVLTAVNGCDSTRALYLTVNSRQASAEDTAICYGSSYKGFSTSGNYPITLTGANGCDSVHTINLVVLPDINRKVWNDTILCTGDTLVISPGVFDSYQWQDGSAGSSFTVTKGGNYSVTVSQQSMRH